ncbi:MAG TPA: sensor domain-containing diguanylate cyclase [Sideroxyarcus sp.]|nr:sensor domain-containing diguanylate cyclase [Sideroxyarcus sp.]
MDNDTQHARMLVATKTLLATLVQAVPTNDVLQTAITALTELLQVRCGAIGLLDEQGYPAHFVQAGMSREESEQIMHHPKGLGLLGVVIRENISLRQDPAKGSHATAGQPTTTSLLAVPISNTDRVYGRIYLCDRFDRNAFSDEDEELALSFARALAQLLDNARLMEELKSKQSRLVHTAYHDPLTNLPNRTLLCDRIGQVLCHAGRHQTQVALLFCDLDGFKAVNDSMGHLAGDQVLKAIGERFIGCMRGEDTVARVGGDEFVFVIDDVESLDQVATVAQKLLDAIARPIRVKSRDLRLSGSIGIALYPFDGDASEQLLRNADAAMYQAKESGKNNYQFFTEERAEFSKQAVLFEHCAAAETLSIPRTSH